MANAEDGLTDSVSVQQFKLVFSEGPTLYVNQYLGDALADGAQAGSKATRQNDNRQTHQISTFVPSKSKRKRTSSNPA